MVAQVARDRRLRRIELGFAGFAIAEYGTWLAGIVYAYELGGADEAGLFAVVLLAPALVVAPLAAFAADRYPSGRVLAVGYALQSVAMFLTAAGIASDAGRVVVYGTAMLASAAVTLTRPAIGVALPNVTHTPSDLTAANVVTGFAEYCGMFLGPGLAGLLIHGWGVALPFAMGGVATGAAALLALGVSVESHVVEAKRPGGAIGDTIDGLRALRRHRGARTTIEMLSIGAIVIGAADVLFVAVADQITAGDIGRAGMFGTAFGVGAMVGSFATLALVGRARLTPPIALAVGVLGVGLAALSTVTGTGLALLLFGVMGAGESLLRVAASTLIQRVAPIDVIGRFFGVAEGIRMFSLAIGSGAIGLLIAKLGFERGLLVAGLAVPALLLVRIGPLFRIDRNAVVPDEEVLRAILGDDLFASLPSPTIERLAADIGRRSVPAGTVVIAEGEVGDRYYLVERGRADVTMAGRHVRTVEPGGSFGEIALLHDVPRTATVTAADDLELLTVEREAFLQAVTGHPRAAAIGRERSRLYLGTVD